VYEKIIGDRSTGCLYGGSGICKSLHAQTTRWGQEDGEKGNKRSEGKKAKKEWMLVVVYLKNFKAR
jgi:hypothetical protein